MIQVVFGPPACGKTRNKLAIAKFLGVSRNEIVDGCYPLGKTSKYSDDSGRHIDVGIHSNSLIFTNMTRAEVEHFATRTPNVIKVMEFASLKRRMARKGIELV